MSWQLIGNIIGRFWKWLTKTHVTQPESESKRLSLIHYTSEEGLTGILQSLVLKPSLELRSARYGLGQYLTDIFPEQISGRSLASLSEGQILAGQLSRGQVARRLFGQPFAGRKLDRFIELDVTGLTVENPAPNIFLIPSDMPLELTERIIRYGGTP